MIEQPERGCFLCTPEPWRVLLEGEFTRVIAGLGPLQPGYVLLSPKEHINTAAQLPQPVLAEFLAVAKLIEEALAHQYGAGYTAYEHGKLGACRPLELTGDLSSFCHHCHRCFIPSATNAFDIIRPFFRNVHRLHDPHDITTFKSTPYVFYETGRTAASHERWLFTNDIGIPSQFMRQILTNALKTGRHYSWASDPRYPEMVATIVALRPMFAGLDVACQYPSDMISHRLRQPITIDGFAGSGKTTLARKVSQFCNCPFVDTGIAWRWFADRHLAGDFSIDLDSLRPQLNGIAYDERLGRIELIPVLRELGRNSTVRANLTQAIRTVLSELPPGVVVGRDAWRIVDSEADRYVVECDLEIRAKRRMLLRARQGVDLDLAAVREELRHEDQGDWLKLPPAGTPGIRYIDNGRRRVDLTVKALLASLQGE